MGYQLYNFLPHTHLPIEETFSTVKLKLRTLETDFSDIETLVLAPTTPENCQGWIASCNIC